MRVLRVLLWPLLIPLGLLAIVVAFMLRPFVAGSDRHLYP